MVGPPLAGMSLTIMVVSPIAVASSFKEAPSAALGTKSPQAIPGGTPSPFFVSACKSIKRPSPSPKSWATETSSIVVAHDNTIISQDGYTALVWKGPSDLFASANNNGGSDNRYYYPVAQNGYARFAWDGPITKLSVFNATLGEERGTYLTAAEKDATLAQWNIPTGGRK